MLGPTATGPALPPGLRAATDGGPPLREDEAVPMPVAITFSDLIANLNPLHHIPVVGWIYRGITGETVNPAFRALGGFLFGGPVGALVAAVGAMLEGLFGRGDGAGGAVAIAAPAAPAAVAPAPAAAAVVSAAPIAAPGVPPPAPPDPAPPMPDGHALAARLGARAHRAPAAAALPPLAAARPAGESDFAERMLRGLEAYERTLRLRRGTEAPAG